jgi:hypothetical protein
MSYIYLSVSEKHLWTSLSAHKVESLHNIYHALSRKNEKDAFQRISHAATEAEHDKTYQSSPKMCTHVFGDSTGLLRKT